MFSKLSPKPTARGYSDEISGFELFYQLVYMSATAAAGISRNRLFDLARLVPVPPARYFGEIQRLVETMRYNYPDACRIVGQRIKSEPVRTFMLRLSDALRSGEPMAAFLAREAEVQGENYENEYERELESLKKWGDGYTSVMVSVALIVIVNLVSTMIYDIGLVTMLGMMVTACITSFVVAWVLLRSAPKETISLSWSAGAADQRRSIKLIKILGPLALATVPLLLLLDAGWAWTMIVPALVLGPAGFVSMRADRHIEKKDQEVSPFLRSLGGTATSRGVTLGRALDVLETDSFPTLEPDIKRLSQRLRAFVKPEICWDRFAVETGSLLISQSTGVFFAAVNLGGDPEQTGLLSSLFAMKASMLRAKRRGVAATFSWLAVVMHTIMAGIMIFLLEIIRLFITLLGEAMSSLGQEGGEAVQAMAGNVMAFNTPPVQLLETMTGGMILVLAFVNAFAIVASEGSHILKMVFYLAILVFSSGLCFWVVPPIVQKIL
ncbi:MAG: type II secretion system F family protein [Chloroflexota bacterium]